MPTSLVLNFSDLGSSGFVNIPESYKGFHWVGYQLDETFGGSAQAALPQGAISGAGFQMTADADNLFDLTSLSITRNNGLGQLDLTIKAKSITPQGLVEVASFVVRTAENENVNNGIFNLLLKNIHQLQIYSNAMETFEAAEIKVMLG
jgi:hypothetical protein